MASNQGAGSRHRRIKRTACDTVVFAAQSQKDKVHAPKIFESAAMTSRPILFSAPMVRALLDGNKTQTRRAWRVQPPPGVRIGYHSTETKNPYGQVGDQLWVRETWGVLYPQFIKESHEPTYWRADYSDSDLAEQKAGTLWLPRWKPSIHMPRNRSRITLEITSVRVERLHDISAAEALAEGIIQLPDGGYSVADTRHYSDSPDESYASLWESLNGAGSWNLNPWVWVIEFKKVTS